MWHKIVGGLTLFLVGLQSRVLLGPTSEEVPLITSVICNTKELKNSFFPRTTVDWNRLENNVHGRPTGEQCGKFSKSWLKKPCDSVLRKPRSVAITPDYQMLQRTPTRARARIKI